jgi:hypothetical protein
VDNELFYNPKAMMYFGSAKEKVRNGGGNQKTLVGSSIAIKKNGRKDIRPFFFALFF